MIEYILKSKKELSPEEKDKAELGEALFPLIMLIIENSYYYNSKNELVMLKQRKEIVSDIMSKLDKYCEKRGIDKKLAIESVKDAIKKDGELKYNKTERGMAMDFLDIEEDNEER